MRNQKLLWLFIATAFFITSCSEDDPVSLDDLDNEVNLEIRPYIESFVEEAALRGQSFDFKKFEATLTFEDIDDKEDICGRSSSFDQKTNSIIIRANETCWIGQHPTTREALVYHELGHAFLDRPHRDDRFDNGIVKSIMETGMLSPYNQYTPMLKEYLIDELFDETTPEPKWMNNKTEELEFSINSSVEADVSGWQFVRLDDFFNRGESFGERSDEFASDGVHSLKITSGKEFESTPVWRLQLTNVRGVPEAADLILTAKVRLQSISGMGIALAGGVDINGQILKFASTESDGPLTGTNDFQTLSVLIPYFPDRAADITLVLIMLPNTTGVVYFDEIQLVARYNPAFGPA